MARLKEIDDEPITQFGSQVDSTLARHILALERAHNERENVLEQIIEWSNLKPKTSAKCEHQEPESILPSATSLMETYWTCGSGDWHTRRQNYALCQQATIEAICRWLECGPESKFYGRLCEILRADADRVLRETKEGKDDFTSHV